MIRLYAYHGSAANPEPVVLNSERVQTQGGGQARIISSENATQRFQTVDAAREYVNETPGAQLGGLWDHPTERVSALEQYRLVDANDFNAASVRDISAAYRSGIRIQPDYYESLRSIQGATDSDVSDLLRTTPSYLKTFEKVPGATIQGSGAPAGSEVRATVQMDMPGGQPFPYTQYATADESGNFELTVPYSTTGYDEFGPDNGYTNVSVRANSEYRLQATSDGALYTGTATVDESQVVGVDDTAVDVELSEEQPLQLGGQSIQASG